MNKAELVAAVAAKTGDTKKAAEASVDLSKLEKELLEKEEIHKLRKKSKYLHQKLQYSKLVNN